MKFMTETVAKTKSDHISPQENQALQFVAMFVHDLEGPLVSIKSLLRLLERQTYDPQKLFHRQLVQSSNIALERAELLVYDLLTAARAGATELQVNLGQCDLLSAITESCQMATPAATERDVAIQTKVPAGISVLADPALLSRVLDNLLYNAIRHTPPDGEIRVEAAVRDGAAEISVTDSGPGFGDINSEDLFSLYKQADFRARGLHRGVGIGLYLCRLAVDKMGGEISAHNSTDRGACFRFTLKLRGSDQ